MSKGRKITTASARAFTTADGRETVLWDCAALGLGLRARPNGRKTWIVRRRCNRSVVRRRLAPLDALTVEEAGHAARSAIKEAESGAAIMTIPTVRVFATAFLADCTERWKTATRKTYAFNVQRWIEPAFGDRFVDASSAKDVRIWFDGIAATHPASARWALAAMSSLMKHAESLRLRP